MESVKWCTYLSSNDRFADVINGTCFYGVQIIKAENLADKDTEYQLVKVNEEVRKGPGCVWQNETCRDVVQKRANGINYVIIGTDSQEKRDYVIALQIYLRGFLMTCSLYPVLTVILYSGAEPWNGPRSFHDMLDLMRLPEKMKNLVPDYRINVIELARLKNTTVFQTDLKHVIAEYSNISKDLNVSIKK